MINKLPNGLLVAFRQMPGRKTVRVCAGSLMGSRHEKRGTLGITHLCEHVLMGGTEKLSASKIKKMIDGLGGNLNAYTGHDGVCVEGHFIKEDWSKGVDLVGDLFFHPAFPERFVEQEKEVIQQEMTMYEDNPQATNFLKARQLLYGKTNLGNDIIGSDLELKNHDANKMKAYWEKVCSTKNSFVYVAGDLDENMMKTIQEYFSILPPGDGVRTKKASINRRNKTTAGTYFKSTDLVYATILYPASPREDLEGCAVTQVLSMILGGGMNSRIWKKIREEMGASYDAASSFTPFRKNGHLEISASLNYWKWEKALYAMMKEFKKLQYMQVPTNHEVRSAVKSILRNMTLAEDDLAGISASDVGDIVAGFNEFTIDYYRTLLSNVTPQDVKDEARRIYDSGPTIHVLGRVNPDTLIRG